MSVLRAVWMDLTLITGSSEERNSCEALKCILSLLNTQVSSHGWIYSLLLPRIAHYECRCVCVCAPVNTCLWIGVTSLIVLETDTECCDVPPRSAFVNEGLIVTIAWECCWKMVLKSQPSLGISKMEEGQDGWSPHSVTDQHQGVRDQTPHPNLEHLWRTMKLQLPHESGWGPPWNRIEAHLLPPPNPGFVPSLLQLIGPKRSP